MKPVKMRRSHQFYEIAVARLVFCQKSEVICGVAARGRPVLMRSGRNICLATDDGLDSSAGRFLIKFNRAE